MIRPNSKLPFKEELKRDQYRIFDTNGNEVGIIHRLADALFIEEASNNYNKCLKFLKGLASTEDSEIGKFLKEIRYENL